MDHPPHFLGPSQIPFRKQSIVQVLGATILSICVITFSYFLVPWNSLNIRSKIFSVHQKDFGFLYKDLPELWVVILKHLPKAPFLKMRSILLTAFAFCAAVFAQTNTADSFLAQESPIAKAGVLANIGPSGSKASGAGVSPCSISFFSSLTILSLSYSSQASSLPVQASLIPRTFSHGPEIPPWS